MKIWNSKNQKINQKVDTFLSGEDINLDNEIFIFDVDASIAHTEELLAIKLLTGKDPAFIYLLSLDCNKQSAAFMVKNATIKRTSKIIPV